MTASKEVTSEYLFESFVTTNCRDGSALNQDIATSQQFQSLVRKNKFEKRNTQLTVKFLVKYLRLYFKENTKCTTMLKRVIKYFTLFNNFLYSWFIFYINDNSTKLRHSLKCNAHYITFKVAPLGPISLCLLFTNLSLFRTEFFILIISHVTSSSNTRDAWKKIEQTDKK